MCDYLLAHWQGEQGLLRSLALNGALLYIVLVVVLLLVEQAANNNVVVTYIGLGIFLLWLVWAVVGIFRCAARYALDRGNPAGSRIGGVIVIVGAVVVVVLMIRDAIHFGLFH